ncbi:uncharacterized protein LOC124273693 isoform X2 [Haliotis rubra]|uniref:uncharacterized protein LOC124273693 isoform X2 n=1 Tax=Haliotis rubra TaxID=36100 RepID=UPI001EE5DD0B|nr:uncharacterized protein LOC124273693 isoform X2 [Haliotis rubra]
MNAHKESDKISRKRKQSHKTKNIKSEKKDHSKYGTDLIPSTQAWEHMFKRMVMMMGAAEGVLDPLELPGAQTLADVNNGIQLRDDKCLLYDKLFGLDLKDSKGDLATIRSETG